MSDDTALDAVFALEDPLPVIKLKAADKRSAKPDIDLLVCIPSLENEIANLESEHRIEALNRRGRTQRRHSVARRQTARTMLYKRAERSSAYSLSDMSKVAMEMDSSNRIRRRVCYNVCLMVLTFFPIALLLSISQLLFTTTAADWDPALG